MLARKCSVVVKKVPGLQIRGGTLSGSHCGALSDKAELEITFFRCLKIPIAGPDCAPVPRHNVLVDCTSANMSSKDIDLSSDEEGDYTTTNVTLGYASVELTGDDISQVGGYPVGQQSLAHRSHV